MLEESVTRQYAFVVLGLLVLLSAAQATTIDFHFTSGASFSAGGTLTCGGSSNSTLDLTCVGASLPTVPLQTLTLSAPPTYYYAGSVALNETQGSTNYINTTEATPPFTFTVSFVTDIPTSFALHPPVSVVGGAAGPTGLASVTMSTTSQGLAAGCADCYLLATVLFSDTPLTVAVTAVVSTTALLVRRAMA